MTPIYEHKQKGGWPFWVVLLAIVPAIVLPSFVPSANIPLPLFVILAVTLLWACALMASLTVSVDNEFVRVRFGPGAFFKKFPIDQIAECNPVRNSWGGGWGIHWIGGCWLYNVAGLDAVELTFKNGKKARVGTDEPETLCSAIRQVIH